MANRHTLAVNKLEDFKQWLIDNDWKIEHTKGNYEVLRARKETEKLPIIVYKKDKEGLIHLSVSDWNLKYVEQFINSKKQKVETAWVIQRENGEFFKEYNEFYIQFTDILDCEKYDVKPIGVLNFLERHKCEFPDELKNLRIMKIEIKVVD